MSCQLFNQPCLEWAKDYLAIPEMPRIDVILTDPNIHYENRESWLSLMSAFCPLAFQLTAPQAHAYLFCDIDQFHLLKSLMESAGWQVFRTPLIYISPDPGATPLPDLGPRRQWAPILYAIKGKKPTTYLYPDVIYSTSRLECLKDLLQRSVRPGDLILDPFAGDGLIIPAAHHLQCDIITVEESLGGYLTCIERVKQLEEENGK